MQNSIQIIRNKNICEDMLITLQSNKIIEGNYQYKKILNDFYSPDNFLFFLQDEDIIPLVLKDNLVSFYGGFHYNEYNQLPQNKELLNFTIDYLQENKLNFRLLSIKNDYIEILNNKEFDIPYGANWKIENIEKYSFEEILSNHKSKERNNLLRCINKQEDYQFCVRNDFSKIEEIIWLSSEYFRARNISFGWEGKEKLFLDLINYFLNSFNILYKTIERIGVLHGAYILIYNQSEIIYFFGGPLKNDNNISTLIYNDILLETKKLNVQKLDAMRGSFGYKKKFGFRPSPLYALVSDVKWKKVLDKDFSQEEYNKFFNRNINMELEK